MQVYTVETPYSGLLVFLYEQDIKPSIELSYSTCHDVLITKTFMDGVDSHDGWIYDVTGTRADRSDTFVHRIGVVRHTVYDKPTHL